MLNRQQAITWTNLAPSHYLNQCQVIVNWALQNKLHWNFNQNSKLFIHVNASQNIVCGIVAILSRGRWNIYNKHRRWPHAAIKASCIRCHLRVIDINTWRHGDQYVHQWTASSLVQIMAWHLFGAKPLSELMMPYCQSEPKGKNLWNLNQNSKHFPSRKIIWKCCLQHGSHFISAPMC